jgi:hypothetical protein
MSTLNVANISDDQSTLTGDSNNLIDLLHKTTTVDTKFVTNGCAKVFGTCKSDGSYYPNSGATLNVSSTSNLGLGMYVYNFVNDVKPIYPAVASTAGTAHRDAQIRARSTDKVEIHVRVGTTGDMNDNPSTLVVQGELA